MDIHLVRKIRVNAQFPGVRTSIAHGGLRAFLHDVAKLAGQGQVPLALHGGHFHMQHFAAGLSPGQAQGHAGHKRVFAFLVQKARCAQQLGHLSGRHHKGAFFALGFTAGQLSAHRPQLSFQVAQTGFTRILTHDSGDGPVAHRNIAVLEAVGFKLPRD